MAHNPDAGITRVKLPSGTKKVRDHGNEALWEGLVLTKQYGRLLERQPTREPLDAASLGFHGCSWHRQRQEH